MANLNFEMSSVMFDYACNNLAKDSLIENETVLRIFNKNIFDDSEFKATFIRNQLEKNIRYSEAKLKQKKIFVNQMLSTIQQSKLSAVFYEYHLDFSKATDNGPHALARAHRNIGETYMLDKLCIANQKPVGYDVLVKDVGGNPIRHLEKTRSYVHSCCPLLSVDDIYRQANYDCALRRFGTTIKHTPMNKLLNQHVNKSKNVICRNKAQDCKVTSPYIMFNHSNYDINVDDIAKIMYSSKSIEAYGCFMFDPIVLYHTSGVLPDIGANFRKIYKNGKLYIEFWFDNDIQNSYTHDYVQYIRLVKPFVLTYANHSYIYKLVELKMSVYFFHVVRNDFGFIPKCSVGRQLPINHMDDQMVLYYWNWETVPHSYNKMKFDPFANFKTVVSDYHMKPKRIVLSKKLYEDLYNYALNLQDGKFTVKALMSAAISFNTREVLNGVAITNTKYKSTPEDLQSIVNAIYFLVFISNYEHSTCLKLLMDEEMQVRKPASCKIIRWIKRLFKRPYVDNHVDIDDVL